MKGKLKKLLASILMLGFIVLCMISLALAAGTKEEEITITIAAVSWPTFDVIKTMIPEFEAETGIKLEIVETPYVEFHSKLMTGLMGGSGMYDLITFHTPWFTSFIEGGYLEPLNKYLDDPKLTDPDYNFDDLIPTKWVTDNGKVYGLPFDGGAVIQFYRKDLYDKYGLKPPAAYRNGKVNLNWPYEYLENAKKLTLDLDGDGEIDVYGADVPAKRGPHLVHKFEVMLRLFGGEIFDENWKPIFNGPEGVKTIKFFHDLLYKYKVAPMVSLENYDDANVTLFLQGKLAHLTSHNYPLALADNPEMSKVVGKWDAAPRAYTTVAAMWFWGIPSDSKNKEAAYKFAHYTTTKKALRILADNHIPTTRFSVMNDPEVLEDNPKFRVVADTAKSTMPEPMLPEWTEVREILMTRLSEILATEKDIAQKTLDKAADEIRELLEERGYY